MIVTIVLVVVNVITRKLFNYIIIWSEEVATSCFVYSVFIGAAYAYRKHQHVGVDLLVERLPAGARRVVHLITNALLVIINGYITVLSVQFIQSSWIKRMPITKLPSSAVSTALIIGFGAESLIADVITGTYRLFEHQYEVGDIIVVGDFRGTVTQIGIRTTQIMDSGGNVKIINNSDITEVTNLSDELSVAICDDCDISYNEDLRRVESIIAKELPNVKKEIPAIVDGPYYKGVSEFYRDGPLLKFVARCKEEDVYQVTRDLKKYIFKMLDDNGVDIPYPQYYVSKADDADSYEEATPKQIANAEAFAKEQASASKGIEPVNGTK